MLVIDFIKEHGLEKLQEELHIVVSDYPDRVVLNYSQIASPKLDPIVRECRALILRKSDWSIMSRSFDRFFNYGEDQNSDSFDITKATCAEKMDGCLQEQTKVYSKEYGSITIGQLVKEKLECRVLSYDVETDEVCWEKVTGHSCSEETDDWYELETMDGKSITVTGNHLVWLPAKQEWKRVDQLKEGDKVLLTKTT